MQTNCWYSEGNKLCSTYSRFFFKFSYERDFMSSLSNNNQADIIEAFNSTSRYLDDLLNIENPYFEEIVNQIKPPELKLNKTDSSDTKAHFLDLHLSISNGFVSSKIYYKRNDLDFDIVNFPFWMAMFHVAPLISGRLDRPLSKCLCYIHI